MRGPKPPLDRRTGGLEKVQPPYTVPGRLDRRTGGLEISNHAVKATYTLDRRTGGLEKRAI